MEGKKISFGFKKTKKAEIPNIIADDEKKEFIECMEEKCIKIVGDEIIKENQPLVIPMKPNTLVTVEKLKEIAEKVESALIEPVVKEEPTNNEDNFPENETLDQMVVRELLQDAKKEVKVEVSMLSIPTQAQPVLEGEKESTLDDYEAVPVQQFGMAMLRGMGWTPNKDGLKYKQPDMRPKGLGLGADTVIKENQKKKASKDNKGEELMIVKNSFVKITTGKFCGYYGKVISLDEDNGRVMVDIPIKKETVSLSEFMMHAVTKSEYDKESKVINADLFQEYKNIERFSQKSKEDEKNSSRENNNIRNDKNKKFEDLTKQRDGEVSSNGRSRIREKERRHSSSSEDRLSRRKKKDKKRYSSSESLSSLSDHHKKQKKHKNKKYRSSSESSNSRDKSPPRNSKRDIDKKRKGKKKKRDRDRSPNYKKHRK